MPDLDFRELVQRYLPTGDTLKRLAQRANVTRQTLHSMAAGKHKPYARTVRHVASALGVPEETVRRACAVSVLNRETREWRERHQAAQKEGAIHA